MDNSKQPDVTSLFRLAATSMSSGIMLIIASTSSQTAVIGFVFCMFSFLALIAAFVQIFPKFQKSCNAILKFNDELTILFILFSFISIFRNWVVILKAINGVTSNIVTSQVLWVQSAISPAIMIWLMLFTVFFCVVVLFDVSKKAIQLFGKLGRKQAVFRLLGSILYTIGCWGVAHYMFVFNASTANLTFFILSIIVTISMFVYLAWHKSKMITVNESSINMRPQNKM